MLLIKEEVRKVIEGYGKDIGVDFEVVYLDEKTMPKDAKGSAGAAFIDKETGKMLIPIDVKKIKDTGSLWGVIAEEVSHIKDGLAGRQDKKVAEDETNKEKGLESLGRPANDYVKNKLGDNSSDISLSTDGIDLTNADVGEKVGDVITPQDRKFRTEHQAKYEYIQIDFDRALNGMVGLTGSVFRGGASYGLIKSGITLLSIPEPTGGTKIVGGILIIGGGVAAVFTISDAVESGQDVYYSVTNQRDKKSINFGREFLGEYTYGTLDMLSVAGMPIAYQYADYRIVIAEGEAAQKALGNRLFLPNEYYDGKKIPSQVTPGIKYLAKYDDMGNIKQIKMYDDYGRQIGWVDYTNHGYPSDHTVPHWHEVIYDEQYKKGIIIDHRTDMNTPLGNK